MFISDPSLVAELIPMSNEERLLYESVVPEDHFLRGLLKAVDFQCFLPLLASSYSSRDWGRPPHDPVVMLKLEVLARHYNLSNREVIVEARLNVGYRLFLGLSLQSPLPHHTLLTYFRQRLGPERMQQIFDALVGQARRLGLVKDRLRLKDATHVIANIAVPSTIRLVAEVRDQLLAALQPFAAERVAAEEQQAEAIRVGSADAKDEERLLQRVVHLQSVLAWADAVPQQEAFVQQSVNVQEKLQSALTLAHKVLADRQHPKAKDKVLSAADPDARRGRHGKFFDGYLVDVAMDADSQLLTAMNVMPANGDEGADAAHLIRQEEQAQGNDVAAVSIDGAGYRGTILRELTDPDGLNLEVFTPPQQRTPLPGFPPERFTLQMIDDHEVLTCPAGAQTSRRERNPEDTGYIYRFNEAACGTCPLRAQCLVEPEAKSRTVSKNDYEAEYAAAQAKAQTAAFRQVRREHPAIERKLAELVRRHNLRHARYRGRPKVLYQGLLTGLVVNLKRIVCLLQSFPAKALGTVRAELVGTS
jgi:transposase